MRQPQHTTRASGRASRRRRQQRQRPAGSGRRRRVDCISWPRRARASGHHVFQKSRLCLSVKALLGPGLVRALQPSRRVGASPDAPHSASGELLTLELGKQKRFLLSVSCRATSLGQKSRMACPPSSRGRRALSKTRRRGSFTVNVMAS
jgi:hypothetical protein